MAKSTSLQPSLSPVNGKPILLGFDGADMSSDAGLTLLREIERRNGLAGLLASCLEDLRDPGKVRHGLAEIIRFRIMMIAAGYEDGNDATELRRDPGFKLALERGPETGAALCSQPTISRMENLADTRALILMGHEMVRFYCQSFARAPGRIVLDIDDTFDTVHGHQQLRLFNAYYDEYGFQPIVVFDGEGRLVGALLRPACRPKGEESAAQIRRLIREIRRHWPRTEILLRADSHYCTPEVLDLCDRLGLRYVFGLARNSRLQDRVQALEARLRPATSAARIADGYAGSRPSPTRPGPGRNPVGSSPGSRSAPWGATPATSLPISRAGVASISTKSSTPPGVRPKTISKRGKPISPRIGRLARRPTPTRCAFAGLTRPHRGHGPGSLLHGAAYWMWWKLRAACPRKSPWRRAQFDTLRLHLVKLAATIVEKKTRITLTLPASCPQKGLLRLLFDALAPPRSA